MAHSSRRGPSPSTAPHLREAEDMKTQKLIELGQPESACRLPSDDESASMCQEERQYLASSGSSSGDLALVH